MTQNIYDNEEFFAGYSRLRRSVEGLDGAPEWPTLRALLPDLRGRSVLALGCGFGWFCRWARQQGAAQIFGIDVSEKMLAKARGTTPDPAITYTRADMEQLDLPAKVFDLPFLDERARRNILGLNAARVFNLPVPARYRQQVAAE